MITLYKVTATKSINIWRIRAIRDNVLLIEWGQLGGAIQQQTEVVETNQSNRSIDEQVELRMQSRIAKQKDKGYCNSIEEAQNSIGLNASKLFKPMLAQTYDRAKHSISGKQFQHKYNGHRCLVYNNGDELIAYSRNGKPIETINHILDYIDIPEGACLDGELYIHDTPLQTISSIVRRVQPANKNLSYVVYDHIADKPFIERYADLHKFNLGGNIIRAPLLPIDEDITNEIISEIAIEQGYEGIMVRGGKEGYECGKRSNQLLKCKRWLDAEFLVKDVVSSKDGWGILECIDSKGRIFRVTAPGTIAEKTEILENKEHYICMYATVEFAEYTSDGIPFHPVAIRFREEE